MEIGHHISSNFYNVQRWHDRVGVPIPASQMYTNPCHCPEAFALLVAPIKKNKLTWMISYSNKALTNIHHDAPNSQVPDISFLEFLVHAVSIASYHS